MRGCGVGLKGVWGTMEACGRVHSGSLYADSGLSTFERAPQTGFPNAGAAPGSRKGGTAAGARREGAGTAATGERGSQRWPGSGRPAATAGSGLGLPRGVCPQSPWLLLSSPTSGPCPLAQMPSPPEGPSGRARLAPLLGWPQAWRARSSDGHRGEALAPHISTFLPPFPGPDQSRCRLACESLDSGVLAVPQFPFGGWNGDRLAWRRRAGRTLHHQPACPAGVAAVVTGSGRWPGMSAVGPSLPGPTVLPLLEA